MALRTITPEHRDLRQISIYLVYHQTQTGAGGSIRQTLGEQIFAQWMELDHLLAQLWESQLIRPKALCYTPQGAEEDVAECMGCLLPEITRRGIIDLGRWVL